MKNKNKEKQYQKLSDYYLTVASELNAKLRKTYEENLTDFEKRYPRNNAKFFTSNQKSLDRKQWQEVYNQFSYCVSGELKKDLSLMKKLLYSKKDKRKYYQTIESAYLFLKQLMQFPSAEMDKMIAQHLRIDEKCFSENTWKDVIHETKIYCQELYQLFEAKYKNELEKTTNDRHYDIFKF